MGSGAFYVSHNKIISITTVMKCLQQLCVIILSSYKPYFLHPSPARVPCFLSPDPLGPLALCLAVLPSRREIRVASERKTNVMPSPSSFFVHPHPHPHQASGHNYMTADNKLVMRVSLTPPPPRHTTTSHTNGHRDENKSAKDH